MNATHSANSGHDTDAAMDARAALEQAQGANLSSDRDRRVHGFALAGFGLVMAAFLALSQYFDGRAGTIVLGFYVVALFLLAAWQKRAAGTVPLGSRQLGWVGMGLSVLFMLASIIWLNIRQGDNRAAGIGEQPDAWWAYALAAVVTALPLLVTGALVARGGRR
ncbi:hypothetical protein BCF74_108119 [Knoellia remsis]|uniref:Uncharacterized protein n=1 Tax=Knoellia remsis TaxID=407159 RepID=A0A2T0UQI5_9MICO|nr:hypothetical protein [Knoellia remsis]PRY60173.1 hypothetical protein BCF74_108119 [Knoellia remsis]